MIEENTIELLKIIVPAVSSFLGAFLAGGIAIYSSLKTAKMSLKNSVKLLRHNAFSQTIADTYQEIVSIITKAIRENRVFNETELNKLGPLTLWVDEEVIDTLHQVMKEKNLDRFREQASSLIHQIRKFVGTNNPLN